MFPSSLSWFLGLSLVSAAFALPVENPLPFFSEDDAVTTATENSPAQPTVFPETTSAPSKEVTSSDAPAVEQSTDVSTSQSSVSDSDSTTGGSEESSTAAVEAASTGTGAPDLPSSTSDAVEVSTTGAIEQASSTSGEQSGSSTDDSAHSSTASGEAVTTSSADSSTTGAEAAASSTSESSTSNGETTTSSAGDSSTASGESASSSTDAASEPASSTSDAADSSSTGVSEQASTTDSGTIESSTAVPQKPTSVGSSTGQPEVRKVAGQEHKKEGEEGKKESDDSKKENRGVTKGTGDGLQICTWNVFRFGPTKFKQPDEFVGRYGKEKLKMMVEQISKADILAMQEYFDKSLVVLNKLRDALSAASGSEWNYTVSESVGRTSKEQYVFLYRTDVAKAGGNDIYPQKEDIFSRTPFFTNFKVSKPGVTLKDITLGTIHTEPKSAVGEMNGLIDTFDWAKTKFGTEDVMVLGDYNADCQYVRKSEWPNVKLFTDPKFQWFIPTGVDTASMNSECTFDRAVVKSDRFKKSFVPGSLKVLDFVTQYGIKVAEARQLSDHFPVCMTFK